MPPMQEPSIPALRPLGHLNKKILESAGDLGVPRIQKKQGTSFKAFNLSSSRPSTARKKVSVDPAARNSTAYVHTYGCAHRIDQLRLI